MRNSGFIWIVVVVLALLDFYVFQAVKTVSSNASPKWKMFINNGFWTISILVLIVLIIIPFINFDTWPKSFRNYLFATLLGIFFAEVLISLFLLIDDIRRLIQWASGKLFFKNTEGENLSGEGISRSAFLSWLGIGIGGGLFSTLIYGFSNKYSYDVKRIQLSFDNLPPAFKGMKIVQISDVHSGSFTDKHAVNKGIDKILNENADLILFTGDLVNDRAIEMNEYINVFNRLKAPMGVYSTLGNHDYGDYVHWSSEEEKRNNLESVKKVHAQLGWRLLMNEHVVLEKGGQQIALLGIENWSAKARFPKHGKMKEAYAGTEKYPFKILMSHDPSHWDAQVRPQYPDIDLALAGHTHGMQFGIELPWFKWSPVQYVYKQWAGLYEEGKQKLYVNRGYGFIGYPGRVGIMPEITVIEFV